VCVCVCVGGCGGGCMRMRTHARGVITLESTGLPSTYTLRLNSENVLILLRTFLGVCGEMNWGQQSHLP
jgi:hypothetical protein